MGVNTFDQRAKTWDSDPKKVERARTVADAILRAIPLRPTMHVLEYGCGTGLLGFALQPHVGSITLADTSQGMLDVLAEKIAASGVSNMIPLRLDLSSDPLPESRFDIITSLMTLHHIPNTAAILRHFYDLLTPGGWLALSDLDSEDGSFHTDGATDIHLGFERGALQNLTRSAGFSGVQFSTVYTIQKNGRAYPLFLMTAQKK